MKGIEARFTSRFNLALKVLADGILLGTAYVAAFYIRFDGNVAPEMREVCLQTVFWVVLLKLVLYGSLGLYRSFWRYSGISELERLLVAGAAGLGTSLFVVTMSREATIGFPRSVYLIDLLMSLILTGGLRFTPRWVRESLPMSSLRWAERIIPARILTRKPRGKRVLVVGAGDAGEMIVRELSRNPNGHFTALGFVDDDPAKQGREIHGVRVLGTSADISRLALEHHAQEIILTLPSATGKEIRAILRSCRGVKASLRIVPSLSEIVSGSASPTELRNVKLEDLLRRDPVNLNLEQISGYLRGKRVLVTGAGGSIGSELCRQIAPFAPAELLLLGRGENSIFSISQELGVIFPSVHRVQIIGDVINKRKLEGVMASHRPQIVFHAGADKHVPLMELNPDEAVLNNIVGTLNVLEVCEAHGVERLVCISTDKAVNPMSVMGCCKRVAEMLVQSRPWKTPSAIVRFGNVLGSRGSVVPTFSEQIRRGGPLTVTHPDMTRYFMTIPEAAQLVVQAGALDRGGEVFVLDMGEQIKIADLAREMVQLSGLSPDLDIPIEFVGPRPGEKLYEELAGHDEKLVSTTHPKILRVDGNLAPPENLREKLEELRTAAIAMDGDRIRGILREIIPTYRPFRKPMIDTRPVSAIQSAEGAAPRPGGDARADR